MPTPIRYWVRCVSFMLLAAAVMFGFASHSSAQDPLGLGEDLFPEFSLSPAVEDSQQPVSWSASYNRLDSSELLELQITANLGRGWHIYSLTQKPGGPKPTRLSVVDPEGAEQVGEWTPSDSPKKSISREFGGLTVEEHEGRVTFTTRVRPPSGFGGEIKVRVDALACQPSGACIPVKETLIANASSSEGAGGAANAGPSAGGDDDQTDDAETIGLANSETFRDGNYVVQWQAAIESAASETGGRFLVRFTAKPDPGYHVYTAAVDDSPSATNFVISNKDGLRVGAPQTSTPVIESKLLPDTSYHPGTVTWTLPVQVPADATAETHTIEGSIVYQACTDTSCQRPMALDFRATLPALASGSDTSGKAKITLTSGKRAAALDLAATQSWVDELSGPADVSRSSGEAVPASEVAGEGVPLAATPADPVVEGGAVTDPASTTAKAELQDAADEASSTSFLWILLLAFGGGLILNVMPCVLPVVGLKVMGFVKQAGEDRRRILVLNLAYIAGILSVFALLAILAITLSFGWGQQLTYFPVRLGLTLALFALALSYFGVWEIPAPGFASGKASQELQQREGLGGAYSKGVFATVMATPCSGPLLGYILGLTLALSSVQTFVIFMVVGAGMSLPYLLVGLRPRLIAWLPKPGPWMETLKQFLAFLFLGTVAFFFATFQDEHKVPVFVALMGVWFGCWLIGRVPSWERLTKRLAAWVAGVGVATAIGIAAFQMIGGDDVLRWEPYSEARLQQLQAQGRTVLLDFGAKWCGNCIYNYETAINTEPTRQMIEELNAVAMYADWTDPDPEIENKLQELNSISIPLLVIYPGSSPEQPIVLRDIVTQNQLLDALQAAGPSTGADTSSIAELQSPRPLGRVAR